MESKYISRHDSMDNLEQTVLTVKTQKYQQASPLDKRLKNLSDIAAKIVNDLAEQKIDEGTLNVADIYFVLSKALEHVSLLNLAEIEDYKTRNRQNKLAV